MGPGNNKLIWISLQLMGNVEWGERPRFCLQVFHIAWVIELRGVRRLGLFTELHSSTIPANVSTVILCHSNVNLMSGLQQNTANTQEFSTASDLKYLSKNRAWLNLFLLCVEILKLRVPHYFGYTAVKLLTAPMLDINLITLQFHLLVFSWYVGHASSWFFSSSYSSSPSKQLQSVAISMTGTFRDNIYSASVVEEVNARQHFWSSVPCAWE